MTFEVYFRAEQALLWFVRDTLSRFPEGKWAGLAAGSASVLACQAALEAILNRLLEEQGKVSDWDRLSLQSKVNAFAEAEGKSINWGGKPWQEIGHLMRVRNWLAHNKETYIGLSGWRDTWVKDHHGKLPKIDIERELSAPAIRRFYVSILDAAIFLCRLVGDKWTCDRLEREDYIPLVS